MKNLYSHMLSIWNQNQLPLDIANELFKIPEIKAQFNFVFVLPSIFFSCSLQTSAKSVYTIIDLITITRYHTFTFYTSFRILYGPF